MARLFSWRAVRVTLLAVLVGLLPATVGAQSYTIAPLGRHQFFQNDGSVCNGCKLYTYFAGTTTDLATYSDNAVTANANPVVMDAYGRATLYLSATNYKFVLKTSADVTIWTQDNIGAVPGTNVSLDVSGTAGEALAAGDVVYLSDGSGSLTAGRWYKADADNTYSSSTARFVAMSPAAVATAASGSFRVQGRITGLTGLSVGSPYYVSATAGALTATPPTNTRHLGAADSTTSVLIAPNPGAVRVPDSDGTHALVVAAGSNLTADRLLTVATGDADRTVTLTGNLTVSATTTVSGVNVGGHGNANITASVAANALTIALTTNAGTTPSAADSVDLFFRNVTAATGTRASVSVTAATTLVVPDTATLGTSNSVAFRAWIVAFNDASTVRIGIINCSNATSVYPLAGWGIASSTTISTSADSAQVFYTDSGVTSVAYVVLGYVTYESGLATAGTYASAPTRVQPFTTDTPLPNTIIQTVAANYATQTSSSSSTYADTGLTATIVMTSAANKVLVRANVAGSYKDAADTELGLTLLRGATQIGYSESGENAATMAHGWGSVMIEVLDALASVASTIYKVTFASTQNAGNVYVQQGSSQSSVVLQEIMG